MRTGTKYGKAMRAIESNPNITNVELGAEIGQEPRLAACTISKLKRRGYIKVHGQAENRRIEVLREYVEPAGYISPEVQEAINFKKDTYEYMVNCYLEDFEKAQSLSDRMAIGKIIFRLLEKMN